MPSMKPKAPHQVSTKRLASKSAVPAITLVFMAHAVRASASIFSFAGYQWEQDNTPNVLGLLGNGATLGGATFSATLPNRITSSVGFIALSGNAGAGFEGAPGFDSTLSLGRQANVQHVLTQSDGTASNFSSAVNLPNGNDGSSARNGLSMSWSGGRSLLNGSGDDFVLYESASTSTSSEGQMVRVHLTGGGYTPWQYRAVDAFSVYTNTPATVEGAFATAFDLSTFGLIAGALVDEIQVANLQSSDRLNTVGSFALSGEVVFSDLSGTLAKPSVGALAGMNPASTFSDAALDPDPLYVGALSAVVPEPATGALLGLGVLLLGRRVRRSLR